MELIDSGVLYIVNQLCSLYFSSEYNSDVHLMDKKETSFYLHFFFSIEAIVDTFWSSIILDSGVSETNT